MRYIFEGSVKLLLGQTEVFFFSSVGVFDLAEVSSTA